MKKKPSRALAFEQGATIIEYALIVGLIALLAIVSMSMLGNSTFTALREVSSNMDEISADL